jgi:hypothetical protein
MNWAVKVFRTGTVVTTHHFIQLITVLNQLVCYIILGWKALPVTNTLAYRAYS